MVTSSPATSSQIVNGDLSSGSTGWTVELLPNTQTNLVPNNTSGGSNANKGYEVTVSPDHHYTRSYVSGYSPSNPWSQAATFEDGGVTLSLEGYGTTADPNTSDDFTPSSGGFVVYGPRLISSVFSADAGDTVSYTWSAQDSGDDYAIRAWLFNADDGTQILVNRSSGDYQAARTDSAAIPSAGTYQFAFDAGSFDATYGRYIGSTAFLDGVEFNESSQSSNTSPELSGSLTLNVSGGVGSVSQLTSASLNVTDSEQASSQLRYEVGVVPTRGYLFEDSDGNGSYSSNEKIAGGSYFTQEALGDGKIYYYYAQQGTSDAFEFTVADGAGGAINNTVFNINLIPDPAPSLASISLSSNLLAINSSAVATFTYDEVITGLDDTDIILNGVPVSFGQFSTSDGGLTWTASMVAASGYEMPSNTFSVGTGVFDSIGQSPSSVTVSPSFAIDTKVDAPSLALVSDTGSDGADLRTSEGTVVAGGLEAGATAFFRSRVAGSQAWSNWTQASGSEYDSGLVGTQEIESYQVDAAGNQSATTAFTFAQNDILFSYKLYEADGTTAATGLNVASWGSAHDQARQYVLSLEAESLHGNALTIDDLDLTVDFNNSIFEAIGSADLQITSELPLANSALIDNFNGLVRFAAGSADALGSTTGAGIGTKAEVARILVNVKDANFVGNNDYQQAGIVPVDAGISIQANLDETVFSDLSTLRERGGANAYQVLGPQIAVARADMDLQETADQLVLGTQRSIGGSTFSNLIRKGDTVSGTVATWSNEGDAAATGVTLSLANGNQNAFLRLTAEGQQADSSGSVTVSDLNIHRGLDGVVDSRDSLTVGLEVTATGQAGSVIDLDEAGYTIESNGGYQWVSSNITSTKNLITFQGDLNYDGRVSMKDLAYLNAGAEQVASGGGVARDVDADFSGAIDLADLAVLDADWGKTLHTGQDSFIGSGSGTEQILIQELAQQGTATWTDTSFADQNAIEAQPDFVRTLDTPAAAYTLSPVIDGDGNPAATSDIQGTFFQDQPVPTAV